MSDPNGFVSNPPSTYVKILSTAREEMNGQFGLVTGFSSERGRYVLILCQTGSQVMLKPENLGPTSSMEKYQAQYQQLRNDPRVQQQIRSFYDKAQQQLGGTKPEYAAAGLGIVLLVMIFVIGFTKMIMLTSLVVLLGLIVAPDVSSFGIRNWKLIVRNFPRRCRETIEQTVPAARGRVTDRMALGLVVVMLAMVGKTLVSSTVRAPPASPLPRTPAVAVSTISSSASLEEAYELGFSDATEKLPFGTSSLESLKTSPPNPPINHDIDYDYIPSSVPPKSSGGGFGFGTAMSLLMIGRTVMQLGMGPSGIFDVQMVMANLQTLPVYQQGLLGFSVYNVLRAFF
jgi:hypothetical protein